MDTASDNGTKAQWRKKMADLRDALPSMERCRLSGRLCENVERDVLAPLRNRMGRPLTVGVYAAFRSEADPSALARTCREIGDTTVAPRIVGDGLEWRVVRDQDDWRAGRWGVPEPDPARAPPLPASQTLDAVLVPGLAFHRDGGRLGYGGGYYDRLYAAEIAQGKERTCWIGFAFAMQLVPSRLPVERHDLALDALATENEVIWLRGRARHDGTE